jgi:curved DNA-binding protein CbpA
VISTPGATDTDTSSVNGHLPSQAADLYTVLGVSQDALDWEIQVAYRRRAAFLSDHYATTRGELKELNAAYEVLGNPARRARYEHLRSALPQPRLVSGNASETAARRYPRFSHPHQIGNGSSGLAELFGVLLVLAVSSVAAIYFLGRIAVDLSPISSMARVMGIGSPDRRAVLDTLGERSTETEDASPASAPPTATATPAPVPIADQFKGSTISVSNPQPFRNTPVNVVAKLRRNGQPAANVDVWATVKYRTVTLRWPQTGTVRTDQTGTATITLNVGNATPGYEVGVDVRAQVDGQELSWPASFTPR